MNERTPRPNRRPAWWALWSTGLIVIALSAAGAWQLTRPPSLPDGVEVSEYRRAAQRFQDLYGRKPGRLDVLSLLGELSVHQGDRETAAACFQTIPSDDPKYGRSARLQAGQVLIELNRAGEAEWNFREFLRLGARDPSVPPAHLAVARSWLAYILSVQLRFEDRATVLRDQHLSGRASLFESKQFFFPSLLIWNSTQGRHRLRKFLEQAPDDPKLNIAEGRYLVGEGRLGDARTLLEAWHERLPNDRTAIAALLECHFERNDWEAFENVMSDVPPPGPDDPWLLTLMRGEFALHREQWDEAVAQFTHLLEDDPTNVTACMGLGRAYEELGRRSDADDARQRILVLAKIRPGLQKVTPSDPGAAEELAAQCDQIHLDEAASVFREHARRIRQALDGNANASIGERG